MSISPSIAVAALPAVRFASQAIKSALDTSLSFASHFAEPATSETSTIASKAQQESRSANLDQLLPKLQQFLKSLGADEQTAIELKSDGVQSIEIDAEPKLKSAIEDWLGQNPDWAEQWQTAARQFLSESPFGRATTLGWLDSPTSPTLSSHISATTAEHRTRLGDPRIRNG